MKNLSHVGKYEVQQLVGEGAMGVVYRALDPMLNRSVAVKVMNDALALDDSFRTRFLREARAAGSLQHPNVITVFDCGETGGHLYIAMEYVEGTDLEQVIESKIPLTLPEKLDIIIGVLNGLAYAHKRGIVHRDMKPANIRVNDEGRALIMDFGIAHTDSSNVTKTGLVLGTPNYMAPEQVTGSPITPQTDIFSVGVVLYELLTSVKPFEGPTLHAVLFRIVGEMPEPPEKIVTGLRADLGEVVMKALAKEPSERYASAAEMANALTKISTSLSTGGTPAGSRTLSLRSSIDMALKEKVDEEVRQAQQATWRKWAFAAAAIVIVGGASAVILRPKADANRATGVVQQADPATVPATQPQQTAPATRVVVAPPVARETPASPQPATTSAPAPESDVRAVTAARTAAQQARRRAVDAGATATQLAAADRRMTAAEESSRKGQRDAAIREMTRAASAFGDAENAARAVASALAAASREPAREIPKPQQVVAAPTAPLPAPAAVVQPTGNPSAEIGAVVSQYARAIESQDVGELRRVYPSMSAAQASSFEEFFRSVRSIRAAFTVSSLQVEGASAEVKLSGTYDFVTSTGRNEHQPLTLQAVLRKEGSTWRFVSIK